MIGVLVAVLALLLTVVCTGLAVSVSPRYYWPAALFSWVLSFLGSWSIGLYTLVATYVFLALAIGYSTGWIRRAGHDLIATGVGIAAWALLVNVVDDYWLFFPLNALLELALG